ncbi:hypothetical protein [Streptomyces griseomycini]|uniref:Uncharacterized protein n=1 Tax=Streptomyces griseomycini TaxID=66895 RepID=A0A7W7PXC8_9ACTN|nr:hypothetical protein [Streptomyces griseomycini]MBB4903004.1 hypothetical protein [Streptomyces griseomycini]
MPVSRVATTIVDEPVGPGRGQAESDVHLVVRVLPVGFPGSAETVPGCLTDVGTEGGQARPRVGCEEAAGHRGPVDAVLGQEALGVRRALGREVRAVAGAVPGAVQGAGDPGRDRVT